MTKRRENGVTRRNGILRKMLTLVLTFATVIALIPVTRVRAAEFSGCLGSVGSNSHTVWTTSGATTKKGTIFAGETFTVISKEGDAYLIEYSTSNGTKQGYLLKDSDVFIHSYGTCLASMKETATVYYGPNSSTYEVAGTVFAGENVVVIETDYTWDCIEYNTTSGRKRGYILSSQANCPNKRFSSIPAITVFNTRLPEYVYVSGRTVVRSGPNTTFPEIGAVNTGDNPILYAKLHSSGGHKYYYIRYTVDSSGKYKTGYIIL